jgi:two-component system response regulator YesN
VNPVKILIADDEQLIRSDLHQKLNNMGFKDVFEAEDGITALQIINEQRPDIVLADIRMPGMDGITLLEQTKKNYDNIKFIFISGYDLFDYAQKAIKYGAFAYLLKPIKYNELSDVIDSALLAINNKLHLDDNISRLESKISENLEVMKTHLIQDILEKDPKADKNLDEKLKDMEIAFPGKYFLIIYISIDNFNLITHDFSLKTKDMLKSDLQRIISEVIHPYKIINYSFQCEDGILYLFNLQDSMSITNKTNINELLHAIHIKVMNATNYTITIGVGSFVEKLQFINSSYRHAQRAVMQRLSKGNNQIIYSDISNKSKVVPKSISFKDEQDLYMYFEECNLKSIISTIDFLYKPYKDFLTADINGLSKLNFQIIMSIYKILNQMNIDPESILSDEFTMYNEVNQCTSIEDIINYFTLKIEVSINHIMSINNKDENRLIERCKEYIHSNYSNDISLETAAKYVHLSPSYLSKLFKTHTGEVFSNYVLNFRINKAKNLLSVGVYKASEVAEMTGFYDIKYFYKVFKKVTGLTPSEYRNL